MNHLRSKSCTDPVMKFLLTKRGQRLSLSVTPRPPLPCYNTGTNCQPPPTHTALVTRFGNDHSAVNHSSSLPPQEDQEVEVHEHGSLQPKHNIRRLNLRLDSPDGTMSKENKNMFMSLSTPRAFVEPRPVWGPQGHRDPAQTGRQTACDTSCVVSACTWNIISRFLLKPRLLQSRGEDQV